MTLWNGRGEEMLSLGQIGPEQITWQNLKQQFVYAFSLGPLVRYIFTAFPVSITGIVLPEMKIVIYPLLFFSIEHRDVRQNIQTCSFLHNIDGTIKLQKAP